MNIIQIVTNSDRCHVSVNNNPVATFLFRNYSDVDGKDGKSAAISRAKEHCFDVLAEHHDQKITAKINTDIEEK